MATRSVILDSHGQTLEVSVWMIETLLKNETITISHSHYGGDLENAIVYRLGADYELLEGGKAALHRVEVLAGAEALSEVQRPLASGGGHLPVVDEGTSIYCSRCGLHISMWTQEKCTGQSSNVRVLVNR